MIRIRALPAVLLLALGGCTTLPLPPALPSTPWEARRDLLQALPGFALRGRIAVAAGSEGFNGTLGWEQDHSLGRIRIDGPLGAGGVSIENDGERLQLATSRGERLDGSAARSELERRLGFALPLAHLRYWVLGVPDPAQPAEETLGPELRLAALEQDGWRIAFPLYEQVGEVARPKRVTLEREGARLKLVVDRWEH
jgi:outer membrane lipoprotein LolB